MKNREIKKGLRKLYSLEESERERLFLLHYEKGKQPIFEVVLRELRYMGLRSLVGGGCLVFLLYLIASTANSEIMWCMSGILPIGVLLSLSMLNRSERYGMGELEMACRFSLEFLRAVKLLILGVFSLMILVIASCVYSSLLNLRFWDSLLYIAIPYLLNVCGGLCICRKWHSRESLFGCIGMTMLSCLIPYIYERVLFLKQLPGAVYGVSLVVLFLFAIRQAMLYLKESENVLWSFS